jgi:hypothetical protein
MKTRRLLLVAVVALLGPISASCQNRATYDLDTLLRDASYVFNRFEEVSTATAAQIDHYPIEIRESSKGALSAVLSNVDREKPALNALLGKSKVSSLDLFDVYTEVVEVAAESEGDSVSSLNWGDQKHGTDLAQLNAKASVLGAKLAVVLRSQIADQELLAACAHNKPSSRK